MKFEEAGQQVIKDDIAFVESIIGRPFPQDLKKFYLDNNGGVPTNGAIFYIDEENDIDVSVKTFLPIRHKRYEGDVLLEQAYKTFVVDKKLITNEFIPFAIDEGAFPYCYNIMSGSIYLFYMDDLESKDGPMRFIASSLSDFINGLSTDRETHR